MLLDICARLRYSLRYIARQTGDASDHPSGGSSYELNLPLLDDAFRAWKMRPGAGQAPIQVLAAAADVSRCTVWRLKRGKSVGLRAMRRIVTVLGLELSDVLVAPTVEGTPISAECESLVKTRKEVREAVAPLTEIDRELSRLLDNSPAG